MKIKKVKAHSVAALSDMTVVDWEIYEWGCGKSGLLRNEACCLVNVGDTRQRFYFRSFNRLDDATLKWCSLDRTFVHLDAEGCGECHKCTSLIPPQATPREHYPPGNVQCSGYSLMVDVLSPLNRKITFSVDGNILEGGFSPKSNYVAVEPNQPQENIVAIEKFYRTGIWSLDPKGCAKNYFPVESQPCVTIQLKVMLWKVESTGTDGSWTDEQEKILALGNDMKMLNLDQLQNATLVTKDGKTITANKVLLEEHSPYFKRCFEKHPNSLSGMYVDVNSGALQGILDWMNTEKIISDCVSWLEEMCKAAVWLELKGFWKNLDVHMGSFCNPDNMQQLQILAERHELQAASAEIAERIRRTSKVETSEPDQDGVIY